MQQTWVPSLGWEDPLEKEMATHSSILAENPMDREAWQATYSPRSCKRVGHDWMTKQQSFAKRQVALDLFDQGRGEENKSSWGWIPEVGGSPQIRNTAEPWEIIPPTYFLFKQFWLGSALPVNETPGRSRKYLSFLRETRLGSLTCSRIPFGEILCVCALVA